MMKLWFILYSGTHAVGVWGPLPYDMEECMRRAHDRRVEIDLVTTLGVGTDGEEIPEDVVTEMKRWTVSCEYRDKKPVIHGR